VCMVYKKPSGAPSWDCSHLSALFPCKMLLTVLHQGQFILNGMLRHSIHLYFLPSLLFHPPPPLASEVIYGSERGSHFLSEGERKRADGFKEKPFVTGEREAGSAIDKHHDLEPCPPSLLKKKDDSNTEG